MAFAMIVCGRFGKENDVSTERAASSTTERRSSAQRGRYLSAIGRRTSAFGKSSISRQSSNNDVAESAELVSEEYKEEERPDNDDVDLKVALGGGEESPPTVENGTIVAVMPDESYLRDEDDKKDVEAAQ